MKATSKIGEVMGAPRFRYHPDPTMSGSLRASDSACVRCGTVRGLIYTGPAYCEAELEDALCSWCIADGSAHAKFAATFADPAGFPDDISPAIVEEIAYRTPGFSAWQQERWLTCCGDAAAFLQPAGYQYIRECYPRLEGSLMMFIVHELGISSAAATRFLHALDRNYGPTAYVFACRHCGAHLAYADYL